VWLGWLAPSFLGQTGGREEGRDESAVAVVVVVVDAVVVVVVDAVDGRAFATFESSKRVLSPSRARSLLLFSDDARKSPAIFFLRRRRSEGREKNLSMASILSAEVFPFFLLRYAHARESFLTLRGNTSKHIDTTNTSGAGSGKKASLVRSGRYEERDRSAEERFISEG